MPDNSKEVEEYARELQEIGRRKPLSDSDFERAKQLMVRLKKQGFTNKEIAGMTAGGWTDSTVKGYTTGVNVIDATTKEAIIALFTDAVKNNLTLSDDEASNPSSRP